MPLPVEEGGGNRMDAEEGNRMDAEEGGNRMDAVAGVLLLNGRRRGGIEWTPLPAGGVVGIRGTQELHALGRNIVILVVGEYRVQLWAHRVCAGYQRGQSITLPLPGAVMPGHNVQLGPKLVGRQNWHEESGSKPGGSQTQDFRGHAFGFVLVSHAVGVCLGAGGGGGGKCGREAGVALETNGECLNQAREAALGRSAGGGRWGGAAALGGWRRWGRRRWEQTLGGGTGGSRRNRLASE
jgi:hypothetical protein